MTPPMTAPVVTAGAASAIALSIGLVFVPSAGAVPIPVPLPMPFNDSACVVREGPNVTRIINGVRYVLYGEVYHPRQPCPIGVWYRVG